MKYRTEIKSKENEKSWLADLTKYELTYFNDANSIDLFDSNNNFLLSVDVSDINPISYTLSYGGANISNLDININYSLASQPTKKLFGQDFNILLGNQWN